jgi:hypothetical protein
MTNRCAQAVCVFWCFGKEPGGVRCEGHAAQERNKQQVCIGCLCCWFVLFGALVNSLVVYGVQGLLGQQRRSAANRCAYGAFCGVSALQ